MGFATLLNTSTSLILLSLLCAGPLLQQVQAQETTTSDNEQHASERFFTDRRAQSEKTSLKDPFAITQHNENFFLAYAHMANTDNLFSETDAGLLNNEEAIFQISVKVPLFLPDQDENGLYFGFTSKSWWQLYNSDLSKPFRETNYEPELFYHWQTDYKLLGLKFDSFRLGINHQSNGESQLRSRSWNRIIGSFMFTGESSLYFLEVWWRIPEEERRDLLDPTGDDNPGITDFLGHFQFGYNKKWDDFQFGLKLRNNLQSDNKGAVELNLNYQITERYQLVLHYFNGYGESLIDYNQTQERIGIGVQLTYW